MRSSGGRPEVLARSGVVVCLVCVGLVIAFWTGCGGEHDTSGPAPAVPHREKREPLDVLASAGLFGDPSDNALRPDVSGFRMHTFERGEHATVPDSADGVVRLRRGDDVWIEILAVGRRAVGGVATDGAVGLPGCRARHRRGFRRR